MNCTEMHIRCTCVPVISLREAYIKCTVHNTHALQNSVNDRNCNTLKGIQYVIKTNMRSAMALGVVFAYTVRYSYTNSPDSSENNFNGMIIPFCWVAKTTKSLIELL